MTIQPLSTTKNNNVVSAPKPAQGGKVKNTPPTITEKPKDSVDITAVAKKITNALESSKTTPAINEGRVEAVKKALAEGSYPIDAERIAQKMIQMEQEQFNDSR